MASPFAALSTSSSRHIWRFGLLASVFVLLWAIGAAYGLGRESAFDAVLCHQLAAAGAWVLRTLGWPASVSTVTTNLLILNSRPTVIVEPPCDGLVLYAFLAGFVLAYPGPPQRRLWFIPMGIVALWLLNIARVVALALNQQYSPETFEFDHHFAFNAIAYAALGGLWLLWTRQSALANGQPSGLSAAASNSPTLPAASSALPTWLTARAVVGVLVLLSLVLVSVFQTQVVNGLHASWVALLANGPAWLLRLPGATAGNMPDSVSHLPIPVGAAYLGLFLGLALLSMRLLLPARAWRTVWRCYVGLGLACGLLMLVGRLGAGTLTYRPGRMLLDFMVSLLPVAGLLVLLWRPTATAATPVASAAE